MAANISPSAGISAGTAAFNPNGASTVGAGETSGAGDGTEAHAGRVGNPLTQRCCPLCRRAFAGRPKKLLPPSAIAEYLAGDTVQQVAARHGMTWPTVRRRLILAGVAIRKQGMRPGTVLPEHANRKVSVAQTAAILAALRQADRPHAVIAAQFGLTRQRIGQIARAHGLRR